MKYSGIGGQAVLEGVMMRNGDRTAVAVRKPNQEIAIVKKTYPGLTNKVTRRIPILRGILSFVDSLITGISTLMVSAAFFDEAEEPAECAPEGETGSRIVETEQEISAKDKRMMGITTGISLVIALAIFVAAPYYLSQVLMRVIPSQTAVTFFEGLIRLAVFVGYILLISRMPDIQRTFMYHGAEHKCINCIEHGLDLTVENVTASSKEHKRCGTSFLMFVVIISIVVFLFIRVDSHVLRIVFRLLLVPVIAGISYEVLRAAGRREGPVLNLVSKPGLWMQGLTTKEPDQSMIEVGIASVEAVFDWKPYVEEVRKEEGLRKEQNRKALS